MEYKESKTFGDIIESEVLKLINRHFPKAYIDNTGQANSDRDIYIPEKEIGIEVKGDYKSKETGNIVIEVEFNGKPSALSVTKSDYWVFVDGERLIWLTPLNIYRFLEQNEYRRTSFVGSGDSVAKFAYLVSHEDLVLFAYEHGKVQMIPKSSKMHYDNIFTYL